ncbi:glycosyltransferase [Pseudomonas sp. GOM6]|uniref:glycosyltransferase n=1 Tax=Pseudomonas sp. GOM6 TaxID=3036944 RepID=UPI00240A4F8E|nr:glycosyltransferase [Pseudomonas sp. GOM6]MDG1579398.1 glycosyltransferase [Pseudomonas sp. GOM6]
MTRRPAVFVLLAHGFGAARWNRLYKAGKIIGLNEEYAYGYHHAEKYGVAVTYSEDADEGLFAKVVRLGIGALLGFDLVHAWRNRRAFFAAEVVWTHTESQSLAATLLCRLYPRRQAPRLILQSVWLCDRWDSFGKLRRWCYRTLLQRADILTFLSPLNQARAQEIFPGKRCELVRFGIATGGLRAPKAPAAGSRLQLLSLGNDRHRDWPTLVAAVHGQAQLELTIVSATINQSLVANMENCRVVKARHNDELEALFAQADLVIVPLVDNLHASGITVVEEAVIKGCPVIVSDTGGLRAYFADDDVRYVPPHDPLALRQAIETLARDTEGALAMARSAQSKIGCPGLSAESFARQHAELSLALLADAGQASTAHTSQQTAM